MSWQSDTFGVFGWFDARVGVAFFVGGDFFFQNLWYQATIFLGLDMVKHLRFLVIWSHPSRNL